MAEEIQKKKISELPSAVYLSDEDVMPVVQGSGSSEATKKADIGLVGSTVAESKTFSNLDTTSKTLVGAINEVNSSLGNVPSADEISYDNTSSGLSASDVQGAIDEIAQGGSGGSTVTVTQIQTTGTKIATITVDSVGTDLYAPNGGGGASAFEDLTDVDIDSSTLASGQVPVYNSNSEKWENGTLTDSVFTDVTGTLTAGTTSITLQDASITTTSTINVYTDGGVDYNSITVATGSVTLTFDAQVSDLPVIVRVWITPPTAEGSSF